MTKFRTKDVVHIDAECNKCGKSKNSAIGAIKNVQGRYAVVIASDDKKRVGHTWCVCGKCAVVINFTKQDYLFVYGNKYTSL
jgi:hypothetical protein